MVTYSLLAANQIMSLIFDGVFTSRRRSAPRS
jgi:hypothetical protein